jgi:hypothetical protein
MEAEGLVGLVRKVMEQDMFKSYKIRNELEFNILLRYVDDTILIGE